MSSTSEIQAIIRKYPAAFHPTRIEPLGAAGGMSGAQFWRIETPQGALMLRRWPTEHPTPERLRFIHSVLFHAAERGVSFLAVPIRTSTGESFVSFDGSFWELTPRMPGTADYEQSPSPQKLGAAMRALAKFHAMAHDFPVPDSNPLARVPAVSRRLARLQELARRGTNELSQALSVDVWPELTPLAHRFLATVPKLLPRASGQLEQVSTMPLPLQPCLRDIWHGHVLFTGENVTGIIDFGAMDIDTPATDVARLLGSLVGDDEVGWQTGLCAYSTIRQLSADEERATKALDATGTIVAGCNWLQWIYVEGRKFEDREQIIERFRRIAARSRVCGQKRKSGWHALSLRRAHSLHA